MKMFTSEDAWSLLCELNYDNINHNQAEPPISLNNRSSHTVNTSRAPQIREHTIKIKRELTNLVTLLVSTIFTKSFSAIVENTIENGQRLFTYFQVAKFPTCSNVPSLLLSSKTTKLNDSLKRYHPIALLSLIYKLLERLLYNRISNTILDVIQTEQAGCRPDRSCTDQVISLTTFIEARYEKKLKTSTAVIDLTAAYDTVWRQDLLCKLFNRPFKAILGNGIS